MYRLFETTDSTRNQLLIEAKLKLTEVLNSMNEDTRIDVKCSIETAINAIASVQRIFNK